MELWLATGNNGKVTELKKSLGDLAFEIHTQSELSYFSQPPEDGASFEDNARIKAKALHAMKPEAWTVADDSGLIVEGLNGLPGIHSARYAGPKAQPSENNAKLLKMMQIRAVPNRKARFECCLVAISPSGEEFVCHGTLEGEISKSAQGTGGFGYDPVFIPEGHTQTLGELPPSEKNRISHRAKALSQLIEVLKK